MVFFVFLVFFLSYGLVTAKRHHKSNANFDSLVTFLHFFAKIYFLPLPKMAFCQ